MQYLAASATRVKRVSSIAFDCIPCHAVLGILCYLSETGEFDCTPRHAVVGILCYPSQTGEFDCTLDYAVLDIPSYAKIAKLSLDI